MPNPKRASKRSRPVELMALDYCPPKGSKYEWAPPTLKHRPWTCHIEGAIGIGYWSRSLSVHRATTGRYQGRVELKTLNREWVGAYTEWIEDPLEAIKATEALGDALLVAEQAKAPPWAAAALALGWHPPNPR